jgi:two-component system, NtrC family, response regulator HydG
MSVGAAPAPPGRTAVTVDELTSGNAAMQACLKRAAIAARCDVPLLLMGETGTGKTLLARTIHDSSRRAGRAFVGFNAAAMNDTLLESQLFGHERGAFTGADRALRGKFEMADGGTLFLDEIADMSPLAQAKILRSVEYGEFERLGSETVRHASVRVVSATNVPLRERIRRGAFREDLYQRLNGLTLVIPPLRERREDLPALIAWELKHWAERLGRTVSSIDPAALDRLLRHDWPGNLRELDHTMQAIVLLAEHDTIRAEDIQLDTDGRVTTGEGIPLAEPQPDGQNLTLAAAVDRYVHRVYELAGGNQHRAARLLGISRTTLFRHLRRPVRP